MKRTTISLYPVSLLGIIATFGLTFGTVYGQAQTETQTHMIPLEDVPITSNCMNTEVVEADGSLKIVTHITLDSNNGFHQKNPV